MPGLIAGKTAWQTSRNYGGKADGTRVYWWLDDAAATADGRRFNITTEYPREPSGRVPKSVQPYELTLLDLERDDWEFGYYEAGARESRPKEEAEQTKIKELIVATRRCGKGAISASALVFVVDTKSDVAPYFVAPLEIIGGDKSVERAILDKIRDAGLFGDRDARDVRVHYWASQVERKDRLGCPASLRILDVIR
ncbi:MAG: hypothetical protein IJO46_04430 [Thermoguttaceae bacterium]|nr:hypothetical protein [Thermoguttaceae bacterium]MBQ7110687.1 hypothetical protein [Thermoguttaceae bacterium]